jgi:hypothetical protein
MDMLPGLDVFEFEISLEEYISGEEDHSLRDLNSF